ncbi:MAG: YIP1 family protein [Pseudomonadota bacterium]
MIETMRTLLGRMLEGLFAPKLSARRVLAQDWGLDVAVQFTLLAYALNAILATLIPGARPEIAGGSIITVHLVNMILQVLLVGVIGAMVWGVGRMFGGAGARDRALVLVAWHTLVTVLLAPFFQLGTAALRDTLPEGEPGGGAVDMSAAPGWVVLSFGVGVSAWLWLLASYTTELHGFRSTWAVLGVMVAVAMLLSVVVLNLG